MNEGPFKKLLEKEMNNTKKLAMENLVKLILKHPKATAENLINKGIAIQSMSFKLTISLICNVILLILLNIN